MRSDEKLALTRSLGGHIVQPLRDEIKALERRLEAQGRKIKLLSQQLKEVTDDA